MYKIMAGSLTIYDSDDKNTYPVSKPSFEEGLNEAGTLTFTIFPDHPNYNSLTRMRTFVTAYRDNREIFYGRVLITDKGLDGRMEVTCEGGLTFFLDTEMGKGQWDETIVAFLQRVIQNHNSQVEADKRFELGVVNVPKSNDVQQWDITSYTITKNVLETMIAGRFGGFFRIRPNDNENGYHYLDYLEDFGRTNTQQIRIGENVIDKDDHISGENLFTILRPIGRAEPTGSGNENLDVTITSLSQSDVTLQNVTKDGEFLRLTDKIQLYGSIVRTEQFNNATTPIDLLHKAEEFITRRGTLLPANCKINYVDLNYLNPLIGEVRLGDMFNDIEGFAGETLTVSSINWDMEDPANDTITFQNKEELNANRLDSNVRNSTGGGGSSSSLSSAASKIKSQESFRYKYIREQGDDLIIFGKRTLLQAEKLESLNNKIFLTVREKDGVPGEYVLRAERHTDDPNGAEMIMNVDGFTFRKKSGFDTDGETILDDYATTTTLAITDGKIQSEIERASSAEGLLGSRITQTADEIRADVYRESSTIYSSISQTASAIRSEVADTEAGLRTYVQQTASGLYTRMVANAGKTWVQADDPTLTQGNTPKEGDFWIESTSQGTWDGAEGFDWGHDEDYDWNKIQGAKVYTWKNDKWELVTDQQQTVSYYDVVDTAEHYLARRLRPIINDQGEITDAYVVKIQEAADEIRSELYMASSTMYNVLDRTENSLISRIGAHPTTIIQNGRKDGAPTSINGRGLKDGDIWIDSANQGSWDEALDLSWGEDADYDWNELRSDKIYVYDEAEQRWHLAHDGTVIADNTDIDQNNEHIALIARNIERMDGENRVNFAQLKVEASRITSRVEEKTQNLGSQIQQTKDSVTSAVGRIERSEGKITAIEGSAIWQRRDSITGVVGKMEVDSSGHLVIKDGAGLRITVPDGSTTRKVTLGTYVNDSLDAGAMVSKITGDYGQETVAVKMGTYINGKLDAGTLITKITDPQGGSEIQARFGTYINDKLDAGTMVSKITDDYGQTSYSVKLGTYIKGKLDAGFIIDKINDGSTVATIKANKINLEGYTTANQFNALQGDFNNIISGVTTASKITASNGNFSNLEITNALIYGGYGDLKKKIINAFSASASGGTITVSSTTLDGSAGPSVNFNIADTQFYQNAVASARIEGWNEAEAQYSEYSQYTPYRVTDRTYQSYTLHYKVANNVYLEAGSGFVKVSPISTTLYEKTSS